jgi:hypothetical protein
MRRRQFQLWSLVPHLLFALVAIPTFAAESAWVKTGVTGRLIYVPDVDGDRIPDFSMVGYGEGQRPIPDDVSVVIHVDPIAGDNTANIQNAINVAASRPIQANGYRGVVELGPGKFNVDGHLSITASGVVLRGAGGGDDLGSNTQIVSQNRTDSIDSASTPVIDIHGSTSGRTYGPEIQITDNRVPVGSQSFHVASTAGMAIGGVIEVYRPSSQAWIEDLGMDLIPDGKEWHAGDRDLHWQRTITRIEGNTVYFDAPITTALDAQWGGGTVRTYSLPGQIRNIGIENLRGQSLDDREELNEVRTPSFIRFTRVEDGYVRDVETRYFPYASVYTSQADGTQHITVDNVTSMLPSGQITGGRRYTFAMDGQMSLVQNSHAVDGRHDFVTGSDVTGPIVFYNSTTSSTHADAGPHHRWGNGLLYDNVTIGGNAINVQNRWTSGSGHGWAGANIVVWNSQANSFIMQAPPTAKGWLVGSTGTINAGDCHLGGSTCAGYYDSHGTRVTVGGSDSLYEAQVNDAADLREFHWTGGDGNWNNSLSWNQAVTPGVYSVSTRDYTIGDIDDYTFNGHIGPDDPYVDPVLAAAIGQESAAPIVGFDTTIGPQNVAFTVQHQLSAGERVIHGYLAMSLKQSGTPAGGDFVQLFDTAPEHRSSFSTLGWSTQLNTPTPFVGVVDMGSYLDQMQSGSVNVWLSDNAGVDWAIYTVAVATPKVDPIGAMVFLDSGSVTVSSHVTPIGGLQNGGPEMPSALTITATGRLEVSQDFAQDAGSSLAVQIGGASAGEFGQLVIGDQALLAGSLSLEVVGGYEPTAGTQIEFLTASGGLMGSRFDNAIVGDLTGQGVWGIEYTSGAAVAELLSTTRYGDLTGDGAITAADWSAFKSGQGVNYAGLSLVQAYSLGDMNGDGVHDLTDYVEFRFAYEAAHGSGSFARMVAGAPEPSTLGLASAFCATVLAAFRRLPSRVIRAAASLDSQRLVGSKN